MTKRNKRGKSKRAKQQQNGNQNMTYVLVAVIVVVVLGLIAVSSRGASSSGPDVSQDRLDLDPVFGNEQATVTVVEYGAYACSSCRAFHQAGVLEQLVEEYAGQVNFVFRDFPVISPAYDRMAANVAQCVLDQSEEHFWNFHNILYTVARPGISNEGELVRMASQIGVNSDLLQTCVDNDSHNQTVQYDEQRARELGLRGTPSFIVNGQQVYNSSPDGLRSAINAALGL